MNLNNQRKPRKYRREKKQTFMFAEGEERVKFPAGRREINENVRVCGCRFVKREK